MFIKCEPTIQPSIELINGSTSLYSFIQKHIMKAIEAYFFNFARYSFVFLWKFCAFCPVTPILDTQYTKPLHPFKIIGILSLEIGEIKGISKGAFASVSS